MSKQPQARTRLSILILSLVTPLALSACATRPPLIAIPKEAKAPCRGPSLDGIVTAGDLAGFSLDQEKVIVDCEKKRAALQLSIETHNKLAKGKRPWPFK